MAVFLVIFLMAVGQNSSSCAKQAQASGEMVIGYGKTVEVKDQRVKVTFRSVVEDSRCPQGEQCIWAGNAGIVLSVAKGSDPPVDVTLNTAKEPRDAGYDGTQIRLVDLRPHPKSGATVKASDYEAVVAFGAAGTASNTAIR